MVLINGVKYACERCIRGHRVTTCTHTDQPLTMIKPKGRPATQCQHCRDQRKIKNLHSSCTCGKKGKSPGTHLSSCICHKNSHCTCSSTNKAQAANYTNIHHLTASEKAKKQSLISAANAEVKKKSSTTSSNGSISANGSSVNLKAKTDGSSSYVIDDILPFESANGFYDLISSPGQSDRFVNGSNPALNDSVFRNSNTPSPTAGRPRNSSQLTNDLPDESTLFRRSTSEDKKFTPSPTKDNSNDGSALQFDINDFGLDGPQLYPAELDLVDNMFPLFPLVGQFSFDKDSNKPLSAIPGEPQSGLARSHSQSSQVSSRAPSRSISSLHGPTYPHSKSNQAVPIPSHVHSQLPQVNGGHSSNGSSTGASSANHSNESFSGKPKPHQPKPLRPSTMAHNTSSSTASSVNGSTPHYQPIRPKRPESVLSITSNSSARSLDTHNNHNSSFINGNLPSASNSSAFPPSAPFPNYDANGNGGSSSAILGADDSSNLNDDGSHYHHFGRTGLGSVFSSTNENAVKLEKDETDLLFYDSLINSNTETLSTSSSFLNFNGSTAQPGKPPHASAFQNVERSLNQQFRSTSQSSSSSYLNGYLQADKSGDIKANGSGGELNTEIPNGYGDDSSTSVIPPSQIPFDYDNSMPMMLDFLPSMYEKNSNFE